MEKPDSSIIQCKGCNQLKTRYRAGKFLNGKDTRFVDAEGRLFNGKLCPDCHCEKIAKRQKNERQQAKVLQRALESK